MRQCRDAKSAAPAEASLLNKEGTAQRPPSLQHRSPDKGPPLEIQTVVQADRDGIVLGHFRCAFNHAIADFVHK